MDVEAALRQVKTRFGEPAVVSLPVRRRWQPVALAIAAGLALLVSGALIWRSLQWSGAAAPATTYSTGVGRTDSLALPDGSAAILGANSRLTMLAGYGDAGRGRTVELEGEAFFDVAQTLALEGYWGRRDHAQAMDVCLEVIRKNAARVDGIKVSLLDKDKEVAMRRRLPGGVRMYTGDDFNFAELIEGDAAGHSDALLGIFDAIAPAASAALSALAAADRATYRDILAPTVPLSRHIFQRPTHAYKTGVVFLAYLNGHQNHFRMIGGAESWRSISHLAELFRLADCAGLLREPESAARRMRHVLALAGVEAA